MGFRLIVEADKRLFEQKVNALLDDDYELVGGVSYHNSVFVVGVMKEDEEDVATTSGVSRSK